MHIINFMIQANKILSEFGLLNNPIAIAEILDRPILHK